MRLTEAETTHVKMGHMDVLKRVLIKEEEEAKNNLMNANKDNFQFWQAHCKLLEEILGYMG